MHDDWRSGTNDTLRYFVKHIGCRIADSGFAVPPSFAVFLGGGAFPAGLVCSFEVSALFREINAIIIERPTEEGTTGNLWLGEVTADVQRLDAAAIVVRSWWGIHGLQLVWEWRASEAPTGTNLDAPMVRLPITQRREGRELARVRRQGPAGRAWRAWYGLRHQLRGRRGEAGSADPSRFPVTR